MDFKIFENFQENCYEVQGKIPRQDLAELYNYISTDDRYKLRLFEKIAFKSGRLSDILMYLSEIMKLQEDKELKKVEYKH